MNKPIQKENKEITNTALLEIMRLASKKVAPVWPLENFVAVNPYLGLADQKFETAAQNLARIGGIQMTLPTSFYTKKFEEGKITRQDIKDAISSKSILNLDLDAFISKLFEIKHNDHQNAAILSTFIDVCAEVTKKDWSRFVTSRISVWAASYFDNGQANWMSVDQKSNIFIAWKKEAELDFTPEITGLANFRKVVKAFPNDPIDAAQNALKILGLPSEALPNYLHRLLLRVGGWSAYAARLDWDNELQGIKSSNLIDFLAILICWEACLFQCLNSPKICLEWWEAQKKLSDENSGVVGNAQITRNLILQEAFDLASQRELISKFENNDEKQTKEPKKLTAQAIFCIDVRSEVFRRNLESVDQGIETLGFAGFFAFAINFVPIAHAEGEAQCPVLIKSGPTIIEEISDPAANRLAYQSRIFQNQINQVWKSFKTGAITCFSFVSPIGLSYLPKLFTDSYGLTRPVPNPDHLGLSKDVLKQKSINLAVTSHNNQTVGIPLEQQVHMAKNALKAMSLTENFASFVLIVGHCATTVNNPHATGLDCGACGGRSGEANAKVAAAVLNNKEVRKQLNYENIVIPDSTVFLACLHDTTLDTILIFNEHDVSENDADVLMNLKQSLIQAGKLCRSERALRMNTSGDVDKDILFRSKDWSQVRPEWGLAGCSTFVVAPRNRTKNINFGGHCFLHSYDWGKDKEFSILELIMTAPMIVTSWINLQYYASTVDNQNFGSGNKTLHNITGGVGVLEGFSGDLRVGLPLQSIHDGMKYQHEPIKLNVIIQAPKEAMNSILEKHKSVKDLCDNGWIYLFAMDEQGKVSDRYVGNCTWKAQ